MSRTIALICCSSRRSADDCCNPRLDFPGDRIQRIESLEDGCRESCKLSSKIRDLVGVYSSRDAFDQVIEQMKQAAADTIDGFAIDKTAVVGGLGKVMQLTKKETSSVLDGLLDTIGQAGYEQGRPLSRATLINAVTAVSHKADTDDVDLWQQRGGQLLNMKPADWQRVAAIAA